MVATVYGDVNNWNVCICTHQTGAAGSETPDTTQGTLIYLLAKEVNFPFKSESKDKDVDGGNSYTTQTGKRNFSCNFNDIIVFKATQATVTAEFNCVFNYFKTLTKLGASKVYCFYKCIADNTYVSLSCNAACTQNTNYMKGYPRDFPAKQAEGNLFYFGSLRFKEVLL